MAYTSQPRKSALTNQNAELVYKYVFRPKKNYQWQECLKMEEKNGFD